MQIIGVVGEKSKSSQIVFETSPELSKDVFDYFQKLMRNPSLELRDGNLIWLRSNIPSSKYIEETAKLLTEAETHIQRQKDRIKIQHDEFLKDVSEETGLPLV